MHVSAERSLRFCIKRHILEDGNLACKAVLRVLDVASADHNGSTRTAFESIGAHYTGADLECGANVDVVMPSPARLPFDDGSFDVVCSLQTFEQAPEFWRLFQDMVRVCRTGGVLIVIAPSAGAEHRYPVDCYRFLPDSFAALAPRTGTVLVDTWRDERGPFHDLVGVFRHVVAPAVIRIEADLSRWHALEGGGQNHAPATTIEAVERRSGEEPVERFLARMHKLLKPRRYMEIGVWQGASLRLAQCPALGIDPSPEITEPLPRTHVLHALTSDEFFFRDDAGDRLGLFDLAYIDGLHAIEYVLQDFMNVERFATASTVIAIDDIFPNHPVQAQRIRDSNHWTGDVWKILHILRQHRPDLLLMPINTEPTGTLLVFGADPQNRVLWNVYDYLMALEMRDADPPAAVLERHGAFSPNDRLVRKVLEVVRLARSSRLNLDSLRQAIDHALPRCIVNEA